MTPPPSLALVAFDRRTYRTYRIGLSRGVELADDNPVLVAALIASTAWTIAREWTQRYGVPFPWHRIAWRVEPDDGRPSAARAHASEALDEVPR